MYKIYSNRIPTFVSYKVFSIWLTFVFTKTFCKHTALTNVLFFVLTYVPVQKNKENVEK